MSRSTALILVLLFLCASGIAYFLQRPRVVSAPLATPFTLTEIEALKSGFPTLGNPIEEKKEDGSRATTEKSTGQGSIVRFYNPQGMLRGENWQKENGDTLIRNFFPSGKIKAATLEREGGSSVLLSFEEGSDAYVRKEIAPDGSSEKTVYDKNGKILEQWIRTREGQIRKKE